MAKRKRGNESRSGAAGDRPTVPLSKRLLNALTQWELAQVVDAFFTVLSPELQEQAIAHLPENTQHTIRQILATDSTTEQTQASTTPTVSLAKQAQIWSDLWRKWDDVVSEASAEGGKYMLQEAHWEPPYFSTTDFIDDLEVVAAQMHPLLPLAFEHEFLPDRGFAAALVEAESEISDGLEDWMDLTDGLFLEVHLTQCCLQWEWLTVQEQGQNAFQLACRIRDYEGQFQSIKLDDDTVLEFFTQLSEVEQRCILDGLTAEQETTFWQTTLADTRSHWHDLYLDLIEQYAPDRYLDNLRKTISQKWKNGLPIIEALLAEQNYAESLTVVQETLHSLLKSMGIQENWIPEESLLVARSGFYYAGEQTLAGQLLQYYQQTAQGLHQTERAHALELQQMAIAHWADWSVMFQAFADSPLAESTRQALFTSWRDVVDRCTKPHIWGSYGRPKPVDTWWLLWLIDSIADAQKGASWFQQQIMQWLTHLPGDQQSLGENYDLLRLLTADLTEIQAQGRREYPWFYQVVIHPVTVAMENDKSRREYLSHYAPADLLEQVMTYWKTHLQNFVPSPKTVSKSDYTNHAQWMAALKEVSPQDYETLLAQWRVEHQRRSNLWKAMKQAGLS